MVTEGTYGQLKGRWRVLLRKNESSQDNTRITTLACMFLHNTCIAQGDAISKKLDLSLDANGQKRNRKEIRKLLQMRNCSIKSGMHYVKNYGSRRKLTKSVNLNHLYFRQIIFI